MRLRIYLLSWMIILTFCACGRKAAPKPPEYFAPRPVEFFAAAGTVDGVLLTWLPPSKKANGKPLDDLRYFQIYRALYEKGERPDFERYAQVMALVPEEQAKGANSAPGKDRAGDLAGRFDAGRLSAGKPAANVQYSYHDKAVAPGARFIYYVEPVNDDRVSGAPSTILSVTYIGEASHVEIFSGLEQDEQGEGAKRGFSEVEQ